MSLISPDRVADVQEMLWQLEGRFGPVLPEVLDQVAVAHALVALDAEPTARDVQTAFAAAGVARPSAAYAAELSAKLRRRIRRRELADLLIDFRQYALGALGRDFGGRTRGREGELRNYLRTYLTPRGYVEAQAGKGNTDLLIPSVPAIIETKVWSDMDAYEAGLDQLSRYIRTEGPKEAYMVVFGDRVPLPAIISHPDEAIAARPRLSGLEVPVIVVPFETDYPSRAAAMEQRRSRSAG